MDYLFFYILLLLCSKSGYFVKDNWKDLFRGYDLNSDNLVNSININKN